MDRNVALPIDVLVLVCDFFPLLPRLRVISFVSKQWCLAARRSIKTIADVKINSAALERARLPCVTSLAPNGDFACDVSAWTSLASIELVLNSLPSRLQLPTSLTSLRLRSTHRLLTLKGDRLISLLRPLMQLTSLSLRGWISGKASALLRIPLAKLTHFEFDTTSIDTHLPFIRAHAPQLTSLRVFSPRDCAAIALVAFPRLRVLKLCLGTREPNCSEMDWIRHKCPALTDLHLHLCSAIAHAALPAELKSLVVSLRLGSPSALSPEVLATLPAFPRLARLKFFAVVTVTEPVALPPQLHKLQVNSLSMLACLSRQPAFRSIRKLTLIASTSAVEALTLPHLRDLQVFSGGPLQAAVAMTQSLVSAAPSLSRLLFSWSAPGEVLTRAGRCNLAKFLFRVQELGLEEVIFYGDLGRSLPQSLAPRLMWLRLRSVFSPKAAEAAEEDVVIAAESDDVPWTMPRLANAVGGLATTTPSAYQAV